MKVIGKPNVFILWHVHKIKGEREDAKLIGVYSSQRQATLARTRSKLLPGFRDHPRGFVIDPYELGVDHWTSGYSTVVSSSTNTGRARDDLPRWFVKRLKEKRPNKRTEPTS
jgi:hypothetical protein